MYVENGVVAFACCCTLTLVSRSCSVRDFLTYLELFYQITSYYFLGEGAVNFLAELWLINGEPEAEGDPLRAGEAVEPRPDRAVHLWRLRME